MLRNHKLMGVDVNNGTEKSSFNKHKNKKILVE
jgi:hypothetical protein